MSVLMSVLKQRRFIAAMFAALVTVALAVGAALAFGAHSSVATRDAPALSVHLTTTTHGADVGPTTTTRPLPQPRDAPTDPNAKVPVVQIGTMSIPKIGLTTPLFEGIWLTVLGSGPGHWPGSAAPGGYGNAVFAGHRVTHTHPFRRIDELGPDDDIIVRTATGTYTYKVTGSTIVTPDRTDIVDQRPGYAITLFACHPPGSAAYRYVVRGTLVTSTPATASTTTASTTTRPGA